jgi:exonuclease III
LVKQDKEGHFILIKEAIHQKEVTINNLYASNFIKHTLKDLKRQIDSNTVVVGDINIPLSPIDRSSTKEINKEILGLNDTINQMDLTDVYIIFHLATAQYTFFSAVHGTLPKINHILGHQASLNKHRTIEIAPAFYLITMQ